MRRLIVMFGALSIAAALLPAPAGATAPSNCPGNDGVPSEVFTGTFGEAVEGA